MQWWMWLLIVVAVCLILCCLIFATNLKSGKKQSKLEEDEKLLIDLIGKLDFLIALSGSFVDIKERLEDIQDKIKYFQPTSAALDHDLRIKQRVDDLKADVSRAVTKGVFHLVSKRIGELELLLVERKQFEVQNL